MNETKFVTSVTARRGFEGPQIILNFNMPADAVDFVRVVRKIYDYPVVENDGVLVAEITGVPGEEKNYTDLDITGGETFYYQLMSFVGGAWYFGPTTRVKSLALQSGTFEERLWNTVTDIYQILDEVGLS